MKKQVEENARAKISDINQVQEEAFEKPFETPPRNEKVQLKDNSAAMEVFDDVFDSLHPSALSTSAKLKKIDTDQTQIPINTFQTSQPVLMIQPPSLAQKRISSVSASTNFGGLADQFKIETPVASPTPKKL